MKISVKFYDWVTPFNGVSVSIVNREFEKMFGRDAKVVLVYRDGVFTGIAEPWAGTLEEAAMHYTARFEEQAQREQEAAEAAQQPSAEERIAAALEYQNLLSM